MTAPRFDIADLDALSDLVISPGYRLLRSRIESELERRRLQLEASADIASTERTRGCVIALRVALEIPAILRDEMKIQIAKDDENGI